MAGLSRGGACRHAVAFCRGGATAGRGSAAGSVVRVLEQAPQSVEALLGRDRGVGAGETIGERPVFLAGGQRPQEALADDGGADHIDQWNRPEGRLLQSDRRRSEWQGLPLRGRFLPLRT